MRRSVIMLAGSGVAVGVMSEILVSSITEASEALGSPFFVGIILVAVVGSAASTGSRSTSPEKQDRPGREHRSRIRSPDRLFVAPSSYSLRSSSVPSDGTGLQRVRDRRDLPSRSSLRTRSLNAESPRGTKVCNCSPSMRCWG